ncbi:MAG: peptidase [Clostridiales bacterium]|nr:MAG: peptidase [Clostridiales bacterium]
MPFFYYSSDSLWTYVLIVLPAVILAMWASANVNSTFKKYSKVPSSSGYTGMDAARRILDANGLTNIRIEHVSGNLTDHYDPKAGVIRLSDAVYANNSAAAIGVAAHEAGHAVQHAEKYAPLVIRNAIIPICAIGSNLAMPLIILGLVLDMFGLCYIGILAFGLAALFQLITLPVEFNASRRALAALESSGRFSDTDLKNAGKTLRAAALTYVAALAVALANLLRIIVIVGGRNRRD